MQNKEMDIRLFKKCGITTNVDGTENNEANIWRLDGYIMPLLEEKYHMESEDEDDGTVKDDDHAVISKDKDDKRDEK